MGLPSLALDERTRAYWTAELRAAGYSVVEEDISDDHAEVEKQVIERGFLIQRADKWIRLLEFRKAESGEAGLVAMTHQDGCSAELAEEIFARLQDAQRRKS